MIEEIFNEELARELLKENHPEIDEALLEDALIRSKGNGWDAAIVYELIIIARGIV